MRILVTGGAGFVGTNLIKRLVSEGHEVLSIDNYCTGTEENHIDGCKYWDYDLSSNILPIEEMLATMRIEKLDCIYHLAALARIQPSLLNPKQSIENNVVSTINILDYARVNDSVIVYAGSSSVHHGVFDSPYAWSKYCGEQLVELYNKVYELPAVICRFYNVYGPHQILGSDYAAVIGIWLDQYQKGEPLTITGTGEQRRDFTHVDDIVDGLIKCGENIDKVSGETFELGRGRNYSMNEIVDMFNGYPRKYIPPRKGEYEVTLCTDKKLTDMLGWKPNKNLPDYIKKILA
tara:strand:+ start:2762 stop:3634 length:873 start_codon:yes stop_codon:yes gene_type:complete